MPETEHYFVLTNQASQPVWVRIDNFAAQYVDFWPCAFRLRLDVSGTGLTISTLTQLLLQLFHTLTQRFDGTHCDRMERRNNIKQVTQTATMSAQ